MSVDYYRYLASRKWALRKQAVRERSGGECERCRKRPAASVHHTSYRYLGAEPLEDLLHLCGPCHKYESGLSDFDPSKCDCDPEAANDWAARLAGDSDLAPLAAAHADLVRAAYS